MAYAIPASSIIEVRRKGLLDGQLVMNVFHYINVELQTDGQAALQSMLAQFDDDMAGPLANCQTDAVTNLILEAQVIWPTRYMYEQRSPTQTTGTLESPTDPSGVAAVVRRRGQLANRQNMGRIYIAGIPSDATVASMLTNTYVFTSLQNVVDAMTQPLVGTTPAGTYVPVIYGGSSEGLAAVVVQSTYDQVVRYQRRREVGRGQ